VINYMITQYSTHKIYILHFHFPVCRTGAYCHKVALLYRILGTKFLSSFSVSTKLWALVVRVLDMRREQLS